MPADPLQCKHPRVQVVSRTEDTEFVECQECGDIFDVEELKDMTREEEAAAKEAAEE